MGIKSQRKGRSGELELVRVLNEYGIQAEPGDPVSYGRTPDVVGVPGIHPEVKRVESLNVTKAMMQAIRDSQKFGDGAPVVFHRKNRTQWLVTMTLNDWIQLYKGVKE